jgi:hypothetical protein
MELGKFHHFYDSNPYDFTIALSLLKPFTVSHLLLAHIQNFTTPFCARHHLDMGELLAEYALITLNRYGSKPKITQNFQAYS